MMGLSLQKLKKLFDEPLQGFDFVKGAGGNTLELTLNLNCSGPVKPDTVFNIEDVGLVHWLNY